ncbi:hypothetical protein GCM10023196_038270 [Actinoallomurus vinaceus]|uniref:Uncharacterized protein n=1 Tax=Actinoallomurus vinaceus TaxID=1080074 RepID=A0ABP8UD97_9ACTN
MKDLHDRLTAANPILENDLGDTAASPRAETLLLRILAEPPEPRSRVRSPQARTSRWAIPAVALAVVAVVLWDTLVPDSIPRQRYVTSGPAYAVLMAAAQESEATNTGRFWHTQGEIGQTLYRDHRGHRYMLFASYPTESWYPTDRRDGEGVVSYDTGRTRLRPVSAADAAAYRADGSPQPNENSDPDFGIQIPDMPDGPELAGNTIYEGDPARLPTDPARLRMAMLTWMRDHDAMPAHPDVWLFREGAKLLNADSRPLTPPVRAAVYRMLAGLPGVRSLGRVRDPLGRPALGVAMTEHTSALGTLEWQLLIHPSSDFLMATRVVVIRHGAMNPKAAPGTIQYLDLRRTAGWTDTPPEHPLPGATRH